MTARIPAQRWLAGLVLWASTLLVGMVVRYFTDQGVAVAFIIVAASFLALTLIGWRAMMIGTRTARRRKRQV